MASLAMLRSAASLRIMSGTFRGVNMSGKHAAFFVQNSRISTDSWSFLNVNKEETYGIIEMKRKPVNALNFEMLTELSYAIDELESDKNCQGLILTSAAPKVFSAGVDITEFLQKDKGRLVQFWHSFQNIWLKLYGSRLATIAAINGCEFQQFLDKNCHGASPAGGCLLAVSCDYRIMADGFRIGPNETLLGIVAPFWFKETLLNTVGHRNTELLLCLGQLLSSKDALDIGLVDSVSQNGVIDCARTEVKKWLAIPAYARTSTKLMLRTPLLDKLKKERDADTKLFVDFVTKDSTQKMIAAYLKNLAEKSKK